MPKQDTFETEQLTDAAFYILLALLSRCMASHHEEH